MTLPQQDKPSLTDTIESILSDIRENCTYLDQSAYGFKVVSFTTTPSVIGLGGETQEVSGVGFEPSVIFFLSCYDYFNILSWGLYAPRLGAYGVGFKQDESGYIKPTVNSSGITNFPIYHRTYNENTYIWGIVEATDSDGFDIYWYNTFTSSQSITTIALCIK